MNNYFLFFLFPKNKRITTTSAAITIPTRAIISKFELSPVEKVFAVPRAFALTGQSIRAVIIAEMSDIRFFFIFIRLLIRQQRHCLKTMPLYVKIILKIRQNYFACFFDFEATRAVPRAARPTTANTPAVALESPVFVA